MGKITYGLSANGDKTKNLYRHGGLNNYSIDVTEATGDFELIIEASVDNNEWNEKYNSGTVSDIDAAIIDVVPNEIHVKCKVTDKSGYENAVVVYATPF